MEHLEFLESIGQIAVALAGFTGIVIAVVERADIPNVSQLQVVFLLRASLSAIFLSFAPYLCGLFVQPELAWVISLALMCVVQAINISFALRNMFTLNVPMLTRYFMLPVGVILLATASFSVFGVGVRPDHMFLVTLVWQLLVATVNFTGLLMGRVTKDVR